MSDAHDLERMPEDWERALAVVAHPDDIEVEVRIGGPERVSS